LKKLGEEINTSGTIVHQSHSILTAIFTSLRIMMYYGLAIGVWGLIFKKSFLTFVLYGVIVGFLISILSVGPVIAFKRKGLKPENDILVVMNMTPVPRHQFPIHVEGKKVWNEIFNSDAKKYGGTGDLTNTSILVHPQDEKGEWSQVLLNLPALSAIVLV
jgi:disulfide bond formation protein DsbB